MEGEIKEEIKKAETRVRNQCNEEDPVSHLKVQPVAMQETNAIFFEYTIKLKINKF